MHRRHDDRCFVMQLSEREKAILDKARSGSLDAEARCYGVAATIRETHPRAIADGDTIIVERYKRKGEAMAPPLKLTVVK